MLNRKLERSTFSTSPLPAHPSALIHSHIYGELPLANAVIHTHSPHSLVFACHGRTIQPFTLQSQTLGEVPCFDSDVDAVKERHRTLLDAQKESITSGVSGYRYAQKHFESIPQQITKVLSSRKHELKRHGLAFTVYKHGVFVCARNMSEAFDNLIRVERNAQVQLLSSNLKQKADELSS